MIDLRRERERRGWTLEQVSHKTGVALRYLLVLERGTAELTGPMRQAREKYLKLLGLREMETRSDDPPPRLAAPEPVDDPPSAEDESPTATLPRSEELPVARLALTAAVLLAVMGLGLRVASLLTESHPDAPAELTQTQPPVAPKDGKYAPASLPGGAQSLSVRANEPTRITVTAGVEVYHDGPIAPGEVVEVISDEKVVLDVADLTAVSITYNSDRVEPLHNLSHSRRLIFLPDDAD
jgi:cytoskeletal protein RodZ